MNADEVITKVFAALREAEQKHPGWPVDPIHAAGILCEEAGELMQASLDFTYRPSQNGYARMTEEAAQAAAMGIRFLLGLNNYRGNRCEQKRTAK